MATALKHMYKRVTGNKHICKSIFRFIRNSIFPSEWALELSEQRSDIFRSRYQICSNQGLPYHNRNKNVNLSINSFTQRQIIIIINANFILKRKWIKYLRKI